MSASDLLPGFAHHRIDTGGAMINVAVGGSGPPLLLLHGNPLTHVTWHRMAPVLSKSHTLVMPDLRGYGDSSKPDGGPDHAGYTFRAMGEDMMAVMRHFGFERFPIVGHDRGGRVGFRMALDHPGAVSLFVPIDIVPTHHVLSNVSLGWGLEAYHWFFMAQKAPFPERLLSADTDYYIDYKLNKKGVGVSFFDPRAMAEYKRCTTAEQIHAVCEDYRATVSLDFEMDKADYGKRRIECPVMIIWGENSHCGRHFKPVEAWREWANDVTGAPLPVGHYPQEQRPDLMLETLAPFLARETA